jgi:hypothetical protein
VLLQGPYRRIAHPDTVIEAPAGCKNLKSQVVFLVHHQADRTVFGHVKALLGSLQAKPRGNETGVNEVVTSRIRKILPFF